MLGHFGKTGYARALIITMSWQLHKMASRRISNVVEGTMCIKRPEGWWGTGGEGVHCTKKLCHIARCDSSFCAECALDCISNLYRAQRPVSSTDSRAQLLSIIPVRTSVLCISSLFEHGTTDSVRCNGLMSLKRIPREIKSLTPIV